MQLEKSEEKSQSIKHEVHTAVPKTSRSRNRWLWCALTLNVFISILLILEYRLLVESLPDSSSLLTLCPVLLVALMLSLLLKRIPLTALSWGLFWGIFYGMTNALLSLLVSIACYSLIHVYILPRKHWWGNK